jgi:hypothetical protein
LENGTGIFRLKITGWYFRILLPGEVVLLSTEMFREGTAVKPSGSNG